MLSCASSGQVLWKSITIPMAANFRKKLRTSERQSLDWELDTVNSSPTSTDWKFPTQTNVHAARVLKPPTTSCNPAPPSMTWDARHGPVRWRPTGSFGDRLRHCSRLRTSPYSPDWKSSMAGNAEEEEGRQRERVWNERNWVKGKTDLEWGNHCRKHTSCNPLGSGHLQNSISYFNSCVCYRTLSVSLGHLYPRKGIQVVKHSWSSLYVPGVRSCACGGGCVSVCVCISLSVSLCVCQECVRLCLCEYLWI